MRGSLLRLIDSLRTGSLSRTRSLKRERPVFGGSPRSIRFAMRHAKKQVGDVEVRTFSNVHAFCLFIGYPRSGHSLVGALLDSHSNIVISHELHALKYVVEGVRRDELYWLICENSRVMAQHGRLWGEYQYRVPGCWQGSFDRLLVLGDKKGGASTSFLSAHPEALERLRTVVENRIKLIHVIRNPYDNIATIARKQGCPLDEAINTYSRLCHANQRIVSASGDTDVISIRHEDLLSAPTANVSRLVRFLGVQADLDYLDACRRVINANPHLTRDLMPWRAKELSAVEQLISKFEFLAGYRFEA
jgi:hypothetical protein